MAIKKTRSAEKALCSISEAGNWEWEWGAQTPVPRPTPHVESQRARAFLGEGRGRPAETAQSARAVVLKWVTGGLTSVTLINTASIQFQVGVFPFLSGQLWELWQLMLWLQSAHHVVSLSIWGGGLSVSITQLVGHGSEYYLQPLRRS